MAWHENRWNGTVCNRPSQNSFCLALDRICEEHNDEEQKKVAGRYWAELEPDQLLPVEPNPVACQPGLGSTSSE